MSTGKAVLISVHPFFSVKQKVRHHSFFLFCIFINSGNSLEGLFYVLVFPPNGGRRRQQKCEERRVRDDNMHEALCSYGTESVSANITPSASRTL